MTHELGIEAAVRAGDDFPGMSCFVNSKHRNEEWVKTIIQAYLSASDMVVLPREPTDEMKIDTMVVGYLSIGASREEAMALAKEKINHDDYAAFSDAQYSAMLSAFPDPFRTKP